MLKLMFILGMAVGGAQCIAQSAPDTPATVVGRDGRVYNYVEQMPEFSGNLREFISNTMVYPPDAAKQGHEGKVIVRFIISDSGIVKNPVVIKTSGYPLLDSEAVRVMQQMPPWTPARQNGKAVSIFYTLPFIFHLD